MSSILPSQQPSGVLISCKKPDLLVQVLRCLDLNSGCGGVPYLACGAPEVVVEAGWIVEDPQSAADIHRANDPSAQVRASGASLGPPSAWISCMQGARHRAEKLATCMCQAAITRDLLMTSCLLSVVGQVRSTCSASEHGHRPPCPALCLDCCILVLMRSWSLLHAWPCRCRTCSGLPWPQP